MSDLGTRPPQMPWRAVRGGIALSVRLTPRSSDDRVVGVSASPDRSALPNPPVLNVRVRAVPSDGRANAAVERLIADWLDVTKSCVALTAGEKSRIKTITVSGDSGALDKLLCDKLAIIGQTACN
jgi:uncharacterized protein